ncbi:MAG TPA: nitroreductase family protein [Ignavibacteriales bacterium]|nr:nitroreductase family protein [Ignavibacteriales bacterium]
MNAIFTRRSIRKYKEGKISQELMRKILYAGMCAPSAGNERPWHFIVIDNRDILNRIADFHPYAKMLTNAAAAIIVCGDLRLEKHKGFWVQDCSAATENILIEIEELGLGGVWVGVYPMQERVEAIQKLFSLDDNIIPLSIVSIGYPDVKPEQIDRYTEDRVHFNKW